MVKILVTPVHRIVIPAKAGIQQGRKAVIYKTRLRAELDPGFRRDDRYG